MSTKIRNLGIEKTLADDADYFLGDDPNNGVTYKITKKNLFTGIVGGGGGGLLTPSSVLVANYQVNFSDLKGHSFTSTGSPVISADKSPYSGGSSLYLPGSSYLEYTANSDFKINADWVIECFVWIPSAYASNNTYASFVSSNGGGLAGNITVGLIRSGYSNNGIFKQLYAQIYSGTQSVDLTCFSIDSAQFNTWNHLAAIRIGSAFYFFLNGVCQSIASITNHPKFASNPTFLIGYVTGFQPLTGVYVAGVRIQSTSVKVPTLPFTE